MSDGTSPSLECPLDVRPRPRVSSIELPALLFVALALSAPGASAQPLEGVGEDLFTSGDDDPLAVDSADRLEEVSPTHADEEVPEHVPVQRGEVLTAIAGVREERHGVEVRLGHGLAVVDTELRFTSSARHAAEVRYRLAVPAGAVLADLEVCSAAGCRRGRPDHALQRSAYDDAVRSRASSGAPLPVAHAALVEDERGAAVILRAAPVLREERTTGVGLTRTAPGDGPLTVRARYVVAAPLRGGRVRLTLPARGRDARAAVARLRVRSDELSGARVDGRDAVGVEVEQSPTDPAELTATLTGAPALATEAWRAPCGERWCVRLRAVAAPQPAPPRDVIVLLDASPSTRGAARGRIVPAVAAVLAALPRGSRVAVGVFAARAEAVIEPFVAPTEVPLLELNRAFERDLGSATRFEAAWALVGSWAARARRPAVMIVGDGGLTSSEASARAFQLARAAGVSVASLNVADRASTPRLREALEASSGVALDVGMEAERAAAGRGVDALEERLARVLAPVAAQRVQLRRRGRAVELGPLRAGEEQVWEARIDGPNEVRLVTAGAPVRRAGPPEGLELALWARAAGGRPFALAAVAPESLARGGACGEGRRQSASAVVPETGQLALAELRRCEAAPLESGPAVTAEAPGRIGRLARHEGQSQLPAGALLELLRQRIVPVARGCFREDRAGRASYSTRAVFELRLSDREVVDARVEGRVRPELARCLERAVDGLEIPAFDGTLEVRYPLYTAPELPPPTLGLEPQVAEAVDAILTDP